MAYTIAHSPLVKTALFASDPNWGRLLAMAIGRADVDDLDVDKVELRINDVLIAENGMPGRPTGRKPVPEAMAPTISASHLLNRGEAEATVWTSDLSYDYVRINAEYRT